MIGGKPKINASVCRYNIGQRRSLKKYLKLHYQLGINLNSWYASNMATDKHLKVESLIRLAFWNYWSDNLSKAKQKAIIIPGFDIPRAGNVDILLPPKEGTTLCLVQRSDYVATYKHSVGQLVGILAHYHAIQDREMREILRGVQNHPDPPEIQQPAWDVLKISKRLIADCQSGDITMMLVTEIPEVPQQARELVANFYPIATLLRTWVITPVNKKKICRNIEFYAVDPNLDPPVVKPLTEALEPILHLPV